MAGEIIGETEGVKDWSMERRRGPRWEGGWDS